jgi:hypothetical protein
LEDPRQSDGTDGRLLMLQIAHAPQSIEGPTHVDIAQHTLESWQPKICHERINVATEWPKWDRPARTRHQYLEPPLCPLFLDLAIEFYPGNRSDV